MAPSRPQDPAQFQTWANDISTRLRAVERRILRKDELDVLQTFEDGSPLGDTLAYNFGAGLRATLTGDRYVEVTGSQLEAGNISAGAIQTRRDLNAGDAPQSLTSGVATTINFTRGTKWGTKWSWNAANPTRVSYPGGVLSGVDIPGRASVTFRPTGPVGTNASFTMTINVNGGSPGVIYSRTELAGGAQLDIGFNHLTGTPGDFFELVVQQNFGVSYEVTFAAFTFVEGVTRETPVENF